MKRACSEAMLAFLLTVGGTPACVNCLLYGTKDHGVSFFSQQKHLQNKVEPGHMYQLTLDRRSYHMTTATLSDLHRLVVRDDHKGALACATRCA